jgi:hypothetical protein
MDCVVSSDGGTPMARLTENGNRLWIAYRPQSSGCQPPCPRLEVVHENFLKKRAGSLVSQLSQGLDN